MYDEVLSRSAVNKTFKMTDSDGSILMLRFDPTLQICRMAATKLHTDTVEKICYIENSYEYLSDPGTARSREFPQAGVEILGNGDVSCDIEAVTVAIESLSAAGLTDFMLEIGQVDYFNGLTAEAGMGDADAWELRGLINKKDMLGVEMFFRGKGIGEPFVSQFMLLPTLFGDADVLRRARKGIKNEKSKQALARLEVLLSALTAAGLDRYVSVDLGLLRGEYYTGLVMKGLSGKLGVPILDGGRYDTLCASFGAPLPAVGFSVGIKRLMIALEREGKLVSCPVPDYAYIADGVDYAFEYRCVTELREKGRTVEKRFGDERALRTYCRSVGIDKAFVVCGSSVKQILGE